MMKLAVTTVLILASLASANALKCYTCSTHSSSSGCGENDFDPFRATETTCAPGEVCAKGVIGEVVARACSPVEEGLTNNKCEAHEEASVELCYCSVDLCNSALSNNLGLVFAFIAFLAAKYL